MMIKLLLTIVFSTSLVYASVDRLKELFEVTSRLERTLEHSCKQEIFNRQLETKLKVDIEQLQAESSERSQTVQQIREKTQNNFYGIFQLNDQLEEIKTTMKGDEKSSSEKVKRLEDKDAELMDAFNQLKNENQEFSRKLELYEAEKIELKKEIEGLKLETEELKLKLKKPDDSKPKEDCSCNSNAIEGLARRIGYAEKTTVNEYVWRIDNYTSAKNSGKEASSHSFFVGRGNYGYRFCMLAYLNGQGRVKNTHVTVYYQILPSGIDNILPWPFLGTIKIEILSQVEDKDNIDYTVVVDKDYANGNPNAFMKPGSRRHVYHSHNYPSGIIDAFPTTTAEESPYLVNDIMYIKMTVSDIKSLK